MSTLPQIGHVEFTVYDMTTGEVKRAGTCPDVDLEKQAVNEGEAVLEGRYSDECYRIVAGAPELIIFTEADNEAKGQKTLRRKRDNLLAASDWTQLADAPLTAQEKQEWRIYRQELRLAPVTKQIPEKPIRSS